MTADSKQIKREGSNGKNDGGVTITSARTIAVTTMQWDK